MEIAHFSVFHGQKHEFLTPSYCLAGDQSLKLVICAQPVPLCLDWTKWNEYAQQGHEV